MSPAKKKSSSRAKGRRRKVGVSRALVVMTILLGVVAVGGLVGLRYLRSPVGEAMLLDRDMGDYYAAVQENLGVALGEVLEGEGMENALRVRAKIVTMQGRRLRVEDELIEVQRDRNDPGSNSP